MQAAEQTHWHCTTDRKSIRTTAWYAHHSPDSLRRMVKVFDTCHDFVTVAGSAVTKPFALREESAVKSINLKAGSV